MQSPNALSLTLTRVLMAGTNCAANTAACVVSKHLGPGLGQMARPPSTSPLGLRWTLLQAGRFSPRISWSASRLSCLAQDDPTSCRSQELSEGGHGKSGRCCWACLPVWHGNRRHCGRCSCGMMPTFTLSLCSLRTRRAFTRPGFSW